MPRCTGPHRTNLPIFTRTRSFGRLAALAVAFMLALSANAQELPFGGQQNPDTEVVTDGPLRVVETEYLYEHPAMRRAHVRVRLEMQPADDEGDPRFMPGLVEVDGERIRGAFWWVDGTAHDYSVIRDPVGSTIDVHVPLLWRDGEEYELRLVYGYGRGWRRANIVHELRHTLAPTGEGGAWDEADSGGHAFVVREVAGLDRQGEIVEFDLTVPEAEYPDPDANVRATLMTEPGVFEPIPVQVYGSGRIENGGRFYPAPVVRFRAAVAMDVPAHGERIVHLWTAGGAAEPEPEQRARLEGGPVRGTVEHSAYRIQLDDPSGQLGAWYDRALDVEFAFTRPSRGGEVRYNAMHYTPDVFDDRVPWAHADDWVDPEARVIAGPVFLDTIRHGPMPGVETVHVSVNYRFTPARHVEAWSAIHVREDTEALALRNAGMIGDLSLFTHAAWPEFDGTVREVPTAALSGNDTGAPPLGRMPIDTPWIAFINADEGYGIAAITTEMAYFHEKGEPVNRSGGHMYVSEYRGRFLYTLRALNINYQAHQRSKRSPISAGTLAHERTFYIPFSLNEGKNDARYEPVIQLYERMRRPLVVMP